VVRSGRPPGRFRRPTGRRVDVPGPRRTKI